MFQFITFIRHLPETMHLFSNSVVKSTIPENTEHIPYICAMKYKSLRDPMPH